MVKEMTKDSFKGLINKKGIVIVDFWAEWCGPCRVLGPIIESVDSHFEGEVEVYKVNIDSEVAFSTDQGIRNIPTVLIYKDGDLVDKKVGVSSKESYIKWIEDLM